MFTNLSRRTILKTLSAISMTGLLPTTLFGQSGTILKRAIPGTGEMLPVIGFGSTAAVQKIMQEGPAQITGLLQTLTDNGGSVVDTAPREAGIDEAFGKVLASAQFRDKLFVTTKIGLNRFLQEREVNRAGGIAQYEQTKRLFQRSPADLIQIESMTNIDVHWPSLKDWKTSAEARYIGITTSATADHERMAAFMKSDKPDFIQVNYSLLEPEAEQVVLPLAHDLGIAVLINSPFNGGEFFKAISGVPLPDWAAEFDCTSWAQFNLKYLLGETAITTILTETIKTSNLLDNLQGGMGRIPDPQTRRKMKAHFNSLRKV